MFTSFSFFQTVSKPMYNNEYIEALGDSKTIFNGLLKDLVNKTTIAAGVKG
jgi:hypothetical protein